MRELCEFRIDERDAQRFLGPEDGETLGLPGASGVRKLLLDTQDARYARIGDIARQYRKQGRSFLSSWDLRRKYTKAELEGAELLQLRVRATVEPEGERCGTEYDDSAGCPHCGAGTRQRNELRLDASSLPRTKDMARTIAGNELLFSARLVEAFHQQGLTGGRFQPVLHKDGKRVIDSWFQVEVWSQPLEVALPTRFGIDPFDPDEKGAYRCPQGHVAGLNLLSELSVKRTGHDGSDVCVTRQLVGPRSRNGGVFRPYPLLLISARMRGLLEGLKAKGFELEVAHFA